MRWKQILICMLLSMLLGYCVLPCDTFEEYFELHMETTEINKKLRELGIE